MNTFETIITKLTTQNLADICQGVSVESSTILNQYLSPTLVKERIDKVVDNNKNLSNVLIHTFHIEYDTEKDEFTFHKNKFRIIYGEWNWEDENIEITWSHGENNQYNIQYPQDSAVGSVLESKIPSIFK